MYFVVFRYTRKAGGMYGVYTWSGYTDQAEFEKLYEKNETEEVIAAGVSEKEARDLCSATPEICRILAAIETSFKDRIHKIGYYHEQALFAIRYDREYCQANGIRKTVLPDLRDHLANLSSQVHDTRNFLFEAAIRIFLSNFETGDIYL